MNGIKWKKINIMFLLGLFVIPMLGFAENQTGENQTGNYTENFELVENTLTEAMDEFGLKLDFGSPFGFVVSLVVFLRNFIVWIFHVITPSTPVWLIDALNIYIQIGLAYFIFNKLIAFIESKFIIAMIVGGIVIFGSIMLTAFL